MATVAKQFHDAIPGAELRLISGAGHMSSMERPAEFNRAILEFTRAHASEP